MSDSYNFNTTDAEMMHSTVPYAKPTVHLQHPFNSKTNHEKLLQYLRCRLVAGMQARDGEIGRFAQIDKDFAGWLQLSEEDKKRKQDHERTGSPQALPSNLPLTFVHIDDMMTYFAQTFAPNRGMFYHTAKPGETDPASQIVTLMNNHAMYSGFFRQVLRGLLSLLKYNRGGYHVTWSRENGPKIVKDETGNDRVESRLTWQGNTLEAIDNYNFLADPLVSITDLHKDGEFAGTAFIRSRYWLQNKASQGMYFNCEEAFKKNDRYATCKYYRSPPQESKLTENDATGAGTNWLAILSESSAYTQQAGYELVEVYVRLNPTEFGLIPGTAKDRASRNRYEVWRFTLLNNTWIIDATYMNNIHGHIPYYMGFLNDDLMEQAQRSTAEILQPLQDFASFLLNTHKYATRSNIWGITVYDPTIIPLGDVPAGEVNARVPITSMGFGKDINQHIWRGDKLVDTKQTMTDLESLMGIINQFFPTQALPSNIASIDRAITDQVAAVQQGANRRQQKTARLIDDAIFRNVRFSMYYNIIQYQPDQEEVTDFYSGKPVKIDLAQLRNTDLPFIIGQGLKTLDRAAAAQLLQQVIFALIQAPKAQQGIDILGLIDYWTSMMDIDVSMKQFELAAPAQGAATPPGAAGGNGAAIQPATAPEAVTSPIYGG